MVETEQKKNGMKIQKEGEDSMGECENLWKKRKKYIIEFKTCEHARVNELWSNFLRFDTISVYLLGC